MCGPRELSRSTIYVTCVKFSCCFESFKFSMLNFLMYESQILPSNSELSWTVKRKPRHDEIWKFTGFEKAAELNIIWLTVAIKTRDFLLEWYDWKICSFSLTNDPNFQMKVFFDTSSNLLNQMVFDLLNSTYSVLLLTFSFILNHLDKQDSV